MRKQSGFTVVELVVVISLIGILAAITIPNLLTWIPKYYIKSAARDLYSNMQLAKMAAIQNSADSTITYSSGPDTYTISGAMTATVTLEDDYRSGVRFDPAPGTAPFSDTSITFDSRGTVPGGPSYAYLSNADGSLLYRVGALVSGVIKLEQQVGGVWQ